MAPTPDTPGRGSETLPAAVVEDLVENPRRRRLLGYLAECGEPVALTDLAAAIGARETESAPDEVPPAVRRAVREDILEHHLPKLTATGAVDYDSMRGTVALRPGPVADRVA